MTTFRGAAALGSAGGLVLAAAPAIVPPTQSAQAAGTTTAWQSGQFHLDTPNVVRRADIVLGRPNTAQSQFMPLGNGTLGAAVWAAGGFTALPEQSQPDGARSVPDGVGSGCLRVISGRRRAALAKRPRSSATRAPPGRTGHRQPRKPPHTATGDPVEVRASTR